MAKFGRYCCATIFSLACLVTTTTPVLAQISAVSVTPSNDDAGASTVYEISFAAATPIPANGNITIAFPEEPEGFDVSGVIVANNVSGLTGGYSSVSAGGTQTVTLVRDNTGNSFSGSATLRIAVVVNHNTVGSYSLSVAATGNSSSNGSFSINAAPLDHFTMSTISSPQTAGTNFSFTVSAFDAFNNPVSFSGTLTLSDNTGTLTPSSVAMSGTTVTVNNANITKAQSGVQITATGGGKSVTSNSFTVDPAGVNSFSLSSIGTQQAGVGFALTMTALDVFGNVATGFVGTVSITPNSGTLTPTTSGAFVAGVRTETVTFLTTGSGKTITVSDGGGHAGTSNSFTVNSGALDHFAVTNTSDGSIGTQTAGTAFSIKMTAQDAYNNTVTSFAGTVSISDNTGTISPTTSGSFSSGVLASQSVTITKAQSGVVITVSGSSKVGQSNSFTVSAGGLDHFVVTNTSGGNIGTQVAGTAFSIRLVAQDQYNNTVTGFGGTVGISLNSGTINPATSGNFSSGVLASQSVTITTAGNDKQITVSAQGKSGSSNLFNVTSQSVSSFTISSIGTQTAGTAFNVTITAKDGQNNTATDFTGTVSLSLNSGTLSPTVTGNFVSGVWSGNVTVLSIAGSPSNKQLTANDGANHTGTSNSFTVNPGALDHFAISTIGSPQTAGVSFNLTMTAQDAYNNTVTSFSGAGNTVTISDNTGTISPTTSGSFSSGVLASQSVTITKAQSGVQITVSGSSKVGQSNSFTVNSGALEHFAVTNTSGGNIGTQVAGTAFNIRVVAQDQYNNTVTSFSSTVGISLNSGTITPTISSSFSSGVLASQSVTIATAGNDKQITVSAQGKSGSSNLFNVTSQSVSSFTISSIGTQTAGTAFNVTITAKDGQNNTATDFTGTVSLTLNSGTLSPTVTGNFVSGVWSGNVTVLSIAGSPSNKQLTANDGANHTGTSNVFTVNPGALDHFAISTISSPQTAGVSFNVTMTAQDANNNTVTSFSGAGNSVSISDNTGTISPTTSGNFSSGVRTESVTVTKAQSGVVITVSGGGKVGQSNSFTVILGDVSSIKLRTASNNGGVEFDTDPMMTSDDSVTIYAAGYDAGSNYLGDVSVTWSRTGNLAPVSGSSNAFTFRPTTAPANGTIVGTYSQSISDATGTITVNTGKPSGAFTLTANPTGIPADNVAQSTITSSALRDADNNLVGSGKKFTITISGLSDLTIVTPDADAGLPGRQIATGASSILTFVIKAGTTGGVATITAVSVDNGLSTSNTTLTLGSLSVLSITAPPLVSQTQQDAVVSMAVKNLGSAQVTDLAGTLSFTVAGANRNGQYNVTASPANPTTVAGNSTQTLTFLVDVNSALVAETVTIDGTATGKVNGSPVTDVGADTPDAWFVQTPAALTVQSVTTTPTTVSRGEVGIAVNVTVRNNFGVSTTAIANMDSVRLVLKSGATNVTSQYTISPNAGNPATIAGGDEATFAFTVDVSVGATLGNITIDARAYGKDANSLAAISDINGATTIDSWTVIDAGAFSIVSLTTSQSSVTAGMTKTWTVRMRVQNNSSSNISMDLQPSSGKTRIRFAVGSDTTGWSITKPSVFDGGGTTLNARQTRNLTYMITQTSSRVGTAVISGFAGGTDLSTNLPVSDTTIDGGSGEVAVQSVASPLVNSVITSQPTVTGGQTQNWTVTAAIFNNGQSAVKYSKTQSSISIANGIGYTYIKPNTFADGDSIVDGFESKNLVFTVDVTGTQIGENLLIAVIFKGEELNSTTLRTSNTGSGLITVQTAAQLQITSTTATTINGNFVNVGQSFTVNVQVSNLGQEIVDSLRVRLITNGGSIIQPPNDQLIANLTNLSPRAIAFAVTAGPVNSNERFTASIISSRAHNTQQPAPISPPPEGGDFEILTVQNPSVLQVQVATSIPTAEAGQTTPFWKIYAIVTNNGGASLQLEPPRVSDISLKIQGVLQSDYAISAPASLLHGGLTLLGTQSDTLVYTVTRTGEVGGTLSITATISGVDKNDNTVRSTAGAGSINVASTAAVRLTNVHPVVFRMNTAGVGFVNKSQAFQISVTVENPSLEAVRDIEVSLSSGGLSTILQTPRPINFIAAGNSASLNFEVTAASSETETGEIFTARIDTAIASVSGTPARVRTATDSTGIVIIQSRAQLVMIGSTDDPDNILTTAQVFQVRGKVQNLGQAPYDDSGLMQLTIPPDYELVNPDPLTRNYHEGETVVWTLRAPPVASGPDIFILAMINNPQDRNINANAFVEQDTASVIVQSLFSDLAITKLFISSPAGASDSVLSTDQFFDVTANIAKSSNLVSGTATLTIPQGYSFRLGPQDAVRNTITETMTWLLQAPPDEHATPLIIALEVVGRDQQNQTIMADTTLPVRTVRKASLALNAFISNPPGARGGQLSVDQTFYIRAELNNSGTAGTVGAARARLDFGNTGVTTQDTLRSIPVNGFIEWEVKAPAVETAQGNIMVALERPYPRDENTGVEASTPQPSKTFPVVTGDQGIVTISDIRISFPSGAQDRIISTGQSFQVTATLAWSNVANLEARLDLPPDFRTETPIKIPTTSQLTWDVTAPGAPADSQYISVVFTAVDSRNPNLVVADTSDSLRMKVVRRADLRLSAQIISPPSAQDGSVSIGQYFTVEATLNNSGQAQVVGSDSLYISLPAGYTTQDPAIKSSIAGKVQWLVRARDTRSSSLNERINIELLVPPQDENTNDDAPVSVSLFQLPIFTEGKRLVIKTLPRRNPNSVARGDQQVSLMGLELQNPGDAGSSNIIVRGVRLSVRDRLGAVVVPSSVLTGMHIQRYGKSEMVFGEITEIPSANPITLPFSVRFDTVRAATRDSLEVTVDLSTNATSTSFFVIIEDSADVDAIDQDSGQRVEIMDSQGRTGTAVEVRSDFSAVVDADYKKAFGNYPNPFGRPERPTTRFVYYLPLASAIEFRIYSLLGELVWQRTFQATDPAAVAGLHDGDIIWDGYNGDGDRVLNGVYIAALKSDSGTVTAKVAVIK